MHARLIAFGRIGLEGRSFDHDVVIDEGQVRRRRKGPSKACRDRYGHTPLSPDEAIPWSARRPIVGTGAAGGLPVMPEVYQEAHRSGVEVLA